MATSKRPPSINEWELECALVSRYRQLLPDFFEQDYKITRQVLLSGRRLDLVLEKDDHAWIIELKKGSPDVVATTRQILDYHDCWKAHFPSKPVSLMVISNNADDAKILAFGSKDIRYRAISQRVVLDALKEGIDTALLGTCNRLEDADDVGRIRFLLSKFDQVTVPGAMSYEPWCHASVFYALIRDGMVYTDPWKKRISVRLFEQKPKCAILYHPEADVAHGDAFLHLNPRAPSWPTNGWHLKSLLERGAIVHRGTDRDGTGTADFNSYSVKDWHALATALNLKGE